MRRTEQLQELRLMKFEEVYDGTFGSGRNPLLTRCGHSGFMPRIAHTVFAGVPILPHHITHRGNRREAVFFSDNDRSRYLTWLAAYCQKHGSISSPTA